MTLPKSIKVGALHFEVELVRDFNEDGRPLDGQIDHGMAKITIKGNLNKQLQVQTLLHEIVHAIESQTGRRQELKEPMIDALAFGFYQVLRDNPDLVKAIMKT